MARRDPPSQQELRRLALIDAGDARVLSFYLDVDGRRFPRRTDLERSAAELLRSARAVPLENRAARASVERDCARIAEYIAKEFDRAGVRSLVVFACSASGLWEEFALGAPVRSRIAVDRHPHVLRLEALIAGAEPTAAVIVGRERARLFLTRYGVTTEIPEVLDTVPGRQRQGGLSASRLSRHANELAQKHHKRAADALVSLCKKERTGHVVLGGPEGIVASFEKELPAAVSELVRARISLPLSASRDRVGEAVAAALATVEREHAHDAVARMLEGFAAGRSAVVGLPMTLAALQDGRVDVLAVGDGSRKGWRCDGCARLGLEDGKCESCGGAMKPVADLYEELVDEALRRRCRVVAAETRPLPDAVGALLRY